MRSLVTVLILATSLSAQTDTVRERTVRADMEFLASDSLQGRGSGTRDELIAATYVAAQLRQAGVLPQGDNGTYLQNVSIPQTEIVGPPTLQIGDKQWTHGKEVAFLTASADVHGDLQKLTSGTTVKPGAAVFVTLRQDKDAPSVLDQIASPRRAGANIVLVAYAEQIRQRFEASLKGDPVLRQGKSTIMLDAATTALLEQLPEGTSVSVRAKVEEKPPLITRNVVGYLPGTTDEVILLSAHVDHLGMNPSLAGDQIYNGADDDASGVTAVLSLARMLATQPKRRRTVYFVLTGAEELGILGATYFREHAPMPLEKIAANLDFEMIGNPDPAVAAETLWLTGYGRSNLGPELAKRGARLVADPHPEYHFFERADNYPLALKGVIAHTISSYGLHKRYHRPDDDLAHIDFEHMTTAIQSLVKPVLWLVNSTFKPEWNQGKKP